MDGRTRPLTPEFLFSYKPTQIQNDGTFFKVHNNNRYLIQNKKLLQAFATSESGEIYIQRFADCDLSASSGETLNVTDTH